MDNSIFRHLLAPPEPEGDDYTGPDGLLYCGKCRTRKSRYFELEPGRLMMVRIMCDCRAAEVKRQEEEEQRRELEKRIQRRREDAIHDLRLRESTFDKDDSPATKFSQAAKKYVENFETMLQNGKGILFHGPIGTGKTFIAACIVNEVCKTHTALMTSFADIASQISANMAARQEIVEKVKRVDLLVLDDLGAERSSEYMLEIVFQIINARYESGKPMIVTTNLKPEEIMTQEYRYSRIYDRVIQMCYLVLVNGVSRRRKELKNDTDELKGLLGL